MAAKRGYYGGGRKPVWEQDHTVGITSKILCMRCNKLKPKTQFSNNKLQELKSKMRGRRTLNPETQGLIPCRACIGGAKSEIRCVACEEYKDLGGFAKSQRSKGDDAAECISCVAIRTSGMPIGAGNDATQDDESDLSEDDFTNMRAGTDEGGISLGHLSIQGDSSGSSAADGSSQSGQNMQTQPAWTAMRGRGFMGGALSNPSASDANQGSFNSSAYGEPSRCTAGAGSTAGKSQASNAPRSKGFAKIKAHKPVSNAPPATIYGDVKGTDNDSDVDDVL